MTEAIVSFVIERLVDLLIKEIKFLSEVQGQVEDAKAELGRIKAFLKDADARARQGDESLQYHVAEIREGAYDLEDVIATFVFNEASRTSSAGSSKDVLKRFSRIFINLHHVGSEIKNLHQVGSEIENITARIAKSRASLKDYKVTELKGNEGASSSNQRQQEREDLRRTFSHNIDSDFVGFEENIKELVEHLKKRGNLHKVVSICGMGGLGKTTLARQVYRHADIRCHFDCFAWASISKISQSKDVWKGILIRLVSPTPERRKEINKYMEDEIAKELYEVLEKKKCLVVLDDIWYTETWDCLKTAFPNVGSESKILLTTRNRQVALHADRNSILHEPMCFDKSNSWELLMKKTYFGMDHVTDSEDDKKKKQLAEEMLTHCGGLPLAITVLGGLLSSKQTAYEWETLHRDIKTYMRKGNIIEEEGSQNVGLSWVLGLSYDDLPYSLKPCFLHLAYFPEDFEIRANELCLIWMAEGFVSTEDMAYQCLSEFVNRCIIQVAECGSTGRIKTCRIHDLMRDMCLSKAKKENFVQHVDLHNQHEAMNSSSLGMATNLSPTNKVRRLAIYLNNHGTDELIPLIKDKKGCLRSLSSVRSLICFNPEPDTSYEQVMKPLFKCFYLLRVLKFENLTRGRAGKLPKEIGNLIHLRFFSVKNSHVEELPPSISNLRYLQTLDLRVSTYFQKKPQRCDILSDICKLEQLRHLYLPQVYRIKSDHLESGKIASDHFILSSHVKSSLQLRNLANLQTLVNASLHYFCLDELEELTSLTKLKVSLACYSSSGPTLRLNSLRSLAIYRGDFYRGAINRGEDREEDYLRSLILSCPQIYKLHLEVPLAKLPEKNQFSPNLIKLTLVATLLKDDPMETLEKLPSLRILLLDHNAFSKSEIICTGGGFPRLESLSICSLHNLTEWKVEEGALPILRRLQIVDCLRLKAIPEGLRYVSTLKEIVIKLMLRQFKKKVERGGDDFYKVQHVHSLVFMNTLEF